MGFKLTFIVLCLLVTYCLVQGADRQKNHKHRGKPTPKPEQNAIKHRNNEAKEDRSHLIELKQSRKVTNRAKGDGTEVEDEGFNLDFDKIPGGAGIKFIYDNLKNIFMAVNRVLNFGFIWDGISGIISIFHLDTGATFVINAAKKVGGFVGYMLTDVRDFIKAITTGAKNIATSSLNLLRSAIRFASNTAGNLVVNVQDLLNSILGVTKQNLKDILGPIYKVVYTVFKPLFDAVKKLANGVRNGLMAILEPILGAIRSVTTPIVNVLSEVLRRAGGVFDNDLFRGISAGLKGVLQNVVGGVVGGVKGIVGGVFGALSGAINGVGSVFQNIGDAVKSALGRGDDDKEDTKGYTSINTKTIDGEEPIHLTYANNSAEFLQHFLREGDLQADLIILYKGGKDNFLAFYNKLTGAVWIMSGITGSIAIFDTENEAGIYIKPNSTTGYAIQPPAVLRADFKGPNAKNVSDAITRLARSIDKLSDDLDTTVDTVTFDVIEVLQTLTAKNLLSSVLTGEALTVVSRLLGNLLKNLAKALPPIIKPALGVANTLLPFLLNLPDNLINGIISLIGNVVKRFLGLFAPDFLAELAKTVVIAALKGLTTPMLAPLLTPISGISTAVSAALLTANTAVDLLHLPD